MTDSFQKPRTRYTKSGRLNIAYQVFGTGAVDLVYIPGWVSNIDLMWACPELEYFLRELGKIARVVLFDKRGTGLSDRIVELSTLEERMDDLRAVMDAVGSRRAVLFGHSEGGSVSALFAATYPDRTIALITFGIFARRRFSPEYPWAPTDTERGEVYAMIERSWGSGDMQLELLAPSKAGDPVFMEWMANYFRSGASPSAALVLTQMNTEVDIVDILGSIKVPTLVLQRTGDIDVHIEEGRFIAERIPGAQFVELEGEDHIFWVGNADRVLVEVQAFLQGTQPAEAYDMRLFTLLVGRLNLPESQRQGVTTLLREFVSRYRGTIVSWEENTFTATFEGPSKAVHCSLDVGDLVRRHGGSLAIGIHIQEAAVDNAYTPAPATERFQEALLDRAKPDKLLITQTVKNLLSGAGLHFLLEEPLRSSVSGERIILFAVTDRVEPDPATQAWGHKRLPENDSFLENVLQSIETHLDDPEYGLDTLCREVSISERQLQRKLKAVANKTPNQLITSVRLHRAKEFLLDHTHNVTEAAYRTGFTSPAYFAKCFKKEFGIKPSHLLK